MIFPKKIFKTTQLFLPLGFTAFLVKSHLGCPSTGTDPMYKYFELVAQLS